MRKPDLERELDRLYAQPLAEFIGVRNELAKKLRAGSDRPAAEAVKARTKPSVTAWAVNALYHHERKRFDKLLEAAAAVRAALAGEGNRRQAEAARRKALRELLGSAAKILAAAGHAATPPNRQRISNTLAALAARDPAADGPLPGRLDSDLEPQGFDALAGLTASLAAAGPAATPSRRTTKRSAPTRKTAPRRAGSAARHSRLEAARQKVEEQRAELARLERNVEEADTAAGKALEQHEQLTEEAAEADRRARAGAEAAAAAKKELAAAKAAATKAKAARRRGFSQLETARRQLERQRDG